MCLCSLFIMKKRQIQPKQKTLLNFFSQNLGLQSKSDIILNNCDSATRDLVKGTDSDSYNLKDSVSSNENSKSSSKKGLVFIDNADNVTKKKLSEINDLSSSPKKTKQMNLLAFTSPTKSLMKSENQNQILSEIKRSSILETKDVLAKKSVWLKRSPKKRKFKESPEKRGLELLSLKHGTLKKLQTSVENNLSELEKRHNNQTNNTENETDFINLAEDSIIISPQKINVKRQKCLLEESSSKRNLVFKESTNGENCSEIFDDDLSVFLKDFPIDVGYKNFNLKELQRCEVISINSANNEEKLITVKNVTDNSIGLCILRNPWNDCTILPKDIVSVKGTKNPEGWVVDWNGLLVTNPDKLISGTTIVGSVFCMRKTVLSHIFKEAPERSRYPMVVGNTVHQLFQEALKQEHSSIQEIEKDYLRIINSKDFIINMYLEKINYAEITNKLHSFIEHIHNFMQRYVFGYTDTNNDNNWSGQIVETQDIEENIWSPVLGIKGKVDATVRVQVKNRIKTMPLELKTGKVSFSIEHRGQVILYCMLLKQLGYLVDSGLLLYLSSEVEMKEIKCEEKETRDLTMLRNRLCHWLIKSTTVETTDSIAFPDLPPPINRKSCSSCPYLVPCYAAIREKNLSELKEGHLLKEVGTQATKHLSDHHINFIFHWMSLIFMEKGSSKSSLSDIWTIDSDIREKSGKCLAQMKVVTCVKDENLRFITIFSKCDGSLLETEFTPGQMIVVSSENHIAHALGIIQDLSPLTVAVMLDKEFKTDKLVSLDAYDSDGTFTIISNNLTVLLEDNAQSATLRELIIDLKIPTFSSKLSSKIKRIGEDIFARLNRDQVRAVLQAISAENYILIKGMPGAGKTTTMAALIELLTRLGLKVLVASYTHSAVDNILINLVDKVKVLRLGPEHRIHPKLKKVTENYYIQSLKEINTANIEEMFTSKEVVGVTCFGCRHLWVQKQLFDVCLVDEAAQISLPAILKPISLAKKFILVGDPKQLPALVLNDKARELGLGKSLFERLDRPAVTSPLTLQYRMNRVINALANDLTYNGQLKCANHQIEEITLSLPQGIPSSCPDWLKQALSTDIAKSVIVLDVESKNISNSAENQKEASLVSDIIEALMKGGVEGDSIGVIAPYNRQVQLLRSKVEKCIEVNTVDQYQGRDKDVIIFSTTRTTLSKENDVLGDWNRLNVAITRAKRKLIIIGNSDFLCKYDNFAKLISLIDKDNILKVT